MSENMYKYYAGIGARKTPDNVLRLMGGIAHRFNKKTDDNWILRSGHADGADYAFESAADRAEIFKPWASHNLHLKEFSYLLYYYNVSDEAFGMAMDYHPAWGRCSDAAKLFHGRNMHIMFGENLDTPVDVVICWTPGGEVKGGTGQALRAALDHGIKIINLGEKR